MLKLILIILIIILQLFLYFACMLSSRFYREEEDNEIFIKNTK